jgi:hypothetical protein
MQAPKEAAARTSKTTASERISDGSAAIAPTLRRKFSDFLSTVCAPFVLPTDTRSTTVPIRRQLAYLLLSTFIAACPRIATSQDNRTAFHYVRSMTQLAFAAAFLRRYFTREPLPRGAHSIITFMTAYCMDVPASWILDRCSVPPVTAQRRVVHFCLAYFVVSEADWRCTFHGGVKHPWAPAGQLSWCRFAILVMISGVLSLVLAAFIDEAMVFMGFTCLSEPRSIGSRTGVGLLLQVCVLMRPVYTLSLWLTGVVAAELGDLQAGTWMVC